MIQFLSGYAAGFVTVCLIGYCQLQRSKRDRLKILQSVFIDNPLPEVDDWDMYQAPHGMGIRVGLETGEIIYGWAKGAEVTEITGIEWGERGGIQAIAQLNEMMEEEESGDEDYED